MIRILQVVNIMDRAGLETMLMNYYRNIDRTNIQFDFLTHRPEDGDYDKEIKSLGGNVYHAPRLYPQNYPAYFKWMKSFFKDHPEYKIVHSHIDSMSFLPLLAAKKAGIPVRIAHSHNTSIDKDFKFFLKQYFRIRINSVCNKRFACGVEAGRFLFGKNQFDVIPNAIDAEQFYFNKEIRNKKRQELNLEGKIVIGHVGRFSYQKNHSFLIKIFNEILRVKKDAILILIGVGEKEEEIKKLVDKFGITKNVIFLGNRSDVFELYQAIDVFILPSLFEGIPVVGIEAQFASLPCVFSNRVPLEVSIGTQAIFIDLNSSAENWANQIISYESKYERANRMHSQEYDIRYAHKRLEDEYTTLI